MRASEPSSPLIGLYCVLKKYGQMRDIAMMKKRSHQFITSKLTAKDYMLASD